MDAFDEEMGEMLHGVISEVYRSRDSLVSRWTIVVESVNEGGGRTTGYFTSPDMQLWEVIGMAEAASEYARTQLQLGYIDNAYPDDGEDEDEEADLG